MTKHETDGRRAKGGGETGMPAPFPNGMPETMHMLFGRGAELQSELLALWSHRAQAWLNWPKQALACKDFADLADAQGRFLTTMQRHYRDYFDSVLKDTLVAAESLEAPQDGAPPEPRPSAGGERPDIHRKAA